MSFPDWEAFSPAYAERTLAEELPRAEVAVAAIESGAPDDFEGLVWALDDATRALTSCWARVEHELAVMNSPAWRELEERWQPKVVAFSLRVGQSRPLYESAKRALEALRAAVGDRVRVRVLEKMVEGAELSGVGLEGGRKERFNAIQARLAELGTAFANAVIDATKAFRYEKDGKVYTIDDANYPETMKHCADREVRERLYRARATRAGVNTPRIAEILALRRELAGILGFPDYAALSLVTKCAPGVGAVNEMIDALDRATAEAAEREDAELGEGLEPWDRAYAAERLRERKYAYGEEELKRHFEFSDVLKGLFRLTEFLFGVEVAEVAGAAKPSVWHSDVRFFEVREAGRTIAHFYLDPYVRNGLKQGGAWMNEFRNRCDRRGETPLAVLVLNLPAPDADGRCLMPMREVETLFHEFGHALQCMLTRVGEEGAAGISLVEWDAVEVASQFMENWCLDARTLIEVPADLKAKVKAAKNFRAASQCRRQLAFAKTDLDLHGPVAAKDPDAVKDANFRRFSLPTIIGDRFLESFTHIFGGGYAAGYYGYKWAEVMSADCYGAFEEAGLDDDGAVRREGARYRETVLAMGGGESAADVFRAFRGRSPDCRALVRSMGLAPVENGEQLR